MAGSLKIYDDHGSNHPHEHAASTGACTVSVTPPSFNLDGVKPSQFKGRASIVTLGCAKNQVDSEVMLGALVKSGFEIVNDASEAEVIIINTCGFLESSVKESVDAILEAAELKEKGRLRQLLVAGCMVERYRDQLKSELPEVDKWVSVDEILRVGDIASGKMDSVLDRAARPYFIYDDTMPRVLSTAPYTSYVKVSEGCDRPCTFCIIPRIRGAMRSRTLDSVVAEIQALSQRGVKEFNLVAQDLTSYGLDRKGPKLSDLLRSIDRMLKTDTREQRWVRMLYAYPVGTDEALLETVLELDSVVKYIDIPLQHSSEAVLKEMKRPLGRYSPRSIVKLIREKAPQIHIRTTFIVGFPGETEKDVDDLESFISEGHFTNVGIFKYSKEHGTPSFEMEAQVSEELKGARYARLMEAQAKVNSKRLSSFVGSRFPVLITGTHEDTDLLLVGRTPFQAPEVDGSVIINDIEPGIGESLDMITPGRFGLVEITEVAGYDLVGTLVKS